MKKLSLLLLIAFISVSVGLATSMAITFTITQTITNTATVVPAGDVKAYWDEDCTELVDEIAWGALATGKSYEKSFYLKNEGDTAAKLAWSSTLSEKVGTDSLTSGAVNVNGYKLSPGEVISVSYSIYVRPDAPFGGFSWSLIVGVR